MWEEKDFPHTERQSLVSTMGVLSLKVEPFLTGSLSKQRKVEAFGYGKAKWNSKKRERSSPKKKALKVEQFFFWEIKDSVKMHRERKRKKKRALYVCGKERVGIYY